MKFNLKRLLVIAILFSAGFADLDAARGGHAMGGGHHIGSGHSVGMSHARGTHTAGRGAMASRGGINHSGNRGVNRGFNRGGMNRGAYRGRNYGRYGRGYGFGRGVGAGLGIGLGSALLYDGLYANDGYGYGLYDDYGMYGDELVDDYAPNPLINYADNTISNGPEFNDESFYGPNDLPVY
jgi:hypothetical protein